MQESLTLQDGTIIQVADFEFGFTLEGKAVVTEEADDGPLIIEGYAADFDIDRQDEAFEPDAFNEGLKAYLQGNPVLLYHHKNDLALGRILDGRLDKKGLFVKAMVDIPEPNTPVADYFRKIKNGIIKGFSVGGKFYRRMTDAGPRIFKCDLREISVTPMPVNPRTLFAVATKAFPEEEKVDTTELEQRITKLFKTFDELEGKAPHPDGPKVAALLEHLVKIHTLAEDVHQNASDPEVADVAGQIKDHAAKHVSNLHKVAARIGPISSYAGASYL